MQNLGPKDVFLQMLGCDETFYHRERSAVVCGSLSPEKILYSNRRPKNPYSDEVWGAEGQWLHGNSLTTKKVSNSWIGIVSGKTRTRDHGYGFAGARVQVGPKNPRVTRANP